MHLFVGEFLAAPALIDLGEFAAAMMALLVVGAVWCIVMILNNIVSPIKGIPIIGGIVNFVDWAESELFKAENWLWQWANPFKFLISTAQWFISNLWDPVIHALDAAYNATSLVITRTIPNAFNAVSYYAHQAVYDLTNQIRLLAWNVVGEIAAATSALTNFMEGWVKYLISVVTATLAADVGALWNALRTDVAGLTHMIAATETYLLGRIGTLEQVLVDDINRVIESIPGAIKGAETYAQGLVAGALAQVLPRIGTVEQDITKDITPALAAVTAVAGTTALALEQFLKNCGNPLCKNLSHFGDELSALEGDFEIGALIALVAFAISDPKGVADAFNDVIVQPMEDVANFVTGRAA